MCQTPSVFQIRGLQSAPSCKVIRNQTLRQQLRKYALKTLTGRNWETGTFVSSLCGACMYPHGGEEYSWTYLKTSILISDKSNLLKHMWKNSVFLISIEISFLIILNGWTFSDSLSLVNWPHPPYKFLILNCRATSLPLFTFMHWRRKWQPTPVFLPGESQERGSLVGCHLWGRTESDTTEAT